MATPENYSKPTFNDLVAEQCALRSDARDIAVADLKRGNVCGGMGSVAGQFPDESRLSVWQEKLTSCVDCENGMNAKPTCILAEYVVNLTSQLESETNDNA